MYRIEPRGKQKEVLALPITGHMVVLGTAGSGKTTIAILRAEMLTNLPDKQKVLVVTFNRVLVEYMREISDANLNNLTVESYHKFATGYLKSRGKCLDGKILDPELKEAYIQEAVNYYEQNNPEESTLKRPIKFFLEEINFIEGFGFENFDEYYQAERYGRSAANIRRDRRKWIYDVYEKYKELRGGAGYEYDWEDLPSYVYNELERDERPRIYTHIIVDEGQDFSPMMIRSLVRAAAPGGTFTFMGDVAQQIYGTRMSWRDSGINTDKVWKFQDNYRNPQPVILFARDISRSKYWKKSEDMIEASSYIAEGPKPLLLRFHMIEKEFAWVVKRAEVLSQSSSVVILCRRRSQIAFFLQALRTRGCEAIEIKRNISGFADVKTVYLSTFHAAKGLEFDHVIIPFLSKDTFPDEESRQAGADNPEEVYTNELRLLYVGVTRSKYGLYMTYSGELSALFPEKSENFDFYEVSADDRYL